MAGINKWEATIEKYADAPQCCDEILEAAAVVNTVTKEAASVASINTPQNSGDNTPRKSGDKQRWRSSDRGRQQRGRKGNEDVSGTDETSDVIMSTMKQRLAILVKSFVDDFQNARMEPEQQQQLIWTILQRLHEDTDIPAIRSLMALIRKCFEEEAISSGLTALLRKKDIPFGMTNLKPPLSYHERTEEWFSEYEEKIGSQNKPIILLKW